MHLAGLAAASPEQMTDLPPAQAGQRTATDASKGPRCRRTVSRGQKSLRGCGSGTWWRTPGVTVQFLFAMRQPLTWPFTECCSNVPVTRSLQLILRKHPRGEHRPGRGTGRGNVRCRRMRRFPDVFESRQPRGYPNAAIPGDWSVRPIVILVGGGGLVKNPEGVGRGHPTFLRRGEYPHPSMRSPYPPSLVPEGWSPLPRSPDIPREIYLLELERWGVVPSFLPDKGGGGLFMKKKTGGRGVAIILEGTPLPGLFGGGGS